MPTTTKQPSAPAPAKPLTTRERIELQKRRARLAQQHARNAHSHVKGVQKQAAPFVGMGLLVLASAALNAAKDATDADAAILGSTAATCIVVAVVAAKQMRKRLDDRKDLSRGIGFVAVAGGWLTTTVATGLSLDAIGILVVLGSALSLHWWAKHRIPNRQPHVAPVSVPVPAGQNPYAARWAEYVGCPGGQLPGSALESPEEVKAGWRFVLRLVPGKQSIATLLSAMVLVRGGLGLTIDQDVIAEKHPVLAEPAVLLTVVTKPQVRDDQEWPGPLTFRDGYVDMGPFIDGEGHARWKVYTKDRMVGGYIQGGSGAGKSRLIESIVMPIADSETHPTVVWFGDGQGNSSSPMLMKHADYSARTHEQIVQMVTCAMLIMELRQDENGLEEEVGFTPTADRPGLLIVIDECHKPLSKFLNPEHAEKLQFMEATIAREGQKVGVQLLLASQESTLGAFGGAGNAAEMLRSNLLMGNGVMMRSKDANARQVFKVDEDPSQFPALPGYALLIDPEEGARSAPFRAYYLTDTLRDFWPDRIRWRSLDVGSANAAGTWYLMRHQLAEMAKEEIRRRVEARRNGTHLGGDTDRVAETAARAVAVHGGDGASALADLPDIAAFPVWNPVTEKVQGRKMHDGHLKVLDALKVGICKPTPIADAVGLSTRRVHDLLDELMDEFGKVERVLNADGRPRLGEYQLIEERR
ncbi:hypothetical protein ACQP2Y_21420 [Actinoplanes sp. CA-051413]|uniref:hypothetical protein n=1 Tax=Actinoplanes sp. CA-051413 TaxID=3239899 RepID=UPI003D972115